MDAHPRSCGQRSVLDAEGGERERDQREPIVAGWCRNQRLGHPWPFQRRASPMVAEREAEKKILRPGRIAVSFLAGAIKAEMEGRTGG